MPARGERTAEVEELRGTLRARPLPSIPSKYFYDERGSRLFEAITTLPEYYLTRAEHALLDQRGRRRRAARRRWPSWSSSAPAPAPRCACCSTR